MGSRNVYFDIETTSGFDASVGRVITFSWARGGERPKAIRNRHFPDDSLIVCQALTILAGQYVQDAVGWASSRFDLPYLCDRWVANGFPVIHIPEISSVDIKPWAERIVGVPHKVPYVSLESFTERFDLPQYKTPFDEAIWKSAYEEQDESAWEYILDHNKKDVLMTRNAWRFMTSGLYERTEANGTSST